MRRQIITILLLIGLFATSMFSLAIADNTNLAPIPDAWGGYLVYGNIVYTSVAPPSANQITDYDTVVECTLGAGSARIDPYVVGSENTAREIDSDYLSISPGVHVVFSCYMKIVEGGDGARIGLDFYGVGGRITSKQSAGSSFPPSEDDAAIQANWVYDYNGGAWQLRTLEFVVPATLQRDGTETQVVPTGIIAWMQGQTINDPQTSVWFADVVLQFDPSEDPTPTPTVTPTPPPPTPTPVPTPTPTPSPTPTPTPVPGASPNPIINPTPTPSPFVSTAQATTNQVFTNVYVALGIAVVSTLIAGCYVIFTSFNNDNGNIRFGVGLVVVSMIEVVIGIVVVNAFQGSMGTVGISLLSIKGIT